MREAAEQQVKEFMGKAERAERELGSKSEVIGGFHTSKRAEIEGMQKVIDQLKFQLIITEMQVEEVWSKGSHMTREY